MLYIGMLLLFLFLLKVNLTGGPVLCGEGYGPAEKDQEKAIFLMDNAGEDDSDIKIAGAEKKNQNDDAIDEARELEKQKGNGNIDKARQLGRRLSEKIIDEDGDPSFGRDNSENDETRIQRRILLAFVVNYTVETKLPNSLLQKVTINEFYDALKKSVPDFYEDLGESGSFSFYFLCVRRGGSVERCVGRTFAMLVGKDGDPIMEELGEALFYHFFDIVEKSVKASDFVH